MWLFTESTITKSLSMSQTRMLQIVTWSFKANGNKSLGLSSPVLFMKKQHCCPFNFNASF